jgi:hypothetical protein
MVPSLADDTDNSRGEARHLSARMHILGGFGTACSWRIGFIISVEVSTGETRC